MARYAVNLADLTKKDNRLLAQYLIATVQGDTVDVRPRQWAGVAVLLDCSDERARAIIKIIRARQPKQELRCYVRKTDTAKTWKAV